MEREEEDGVTGTCGGWEGKMKDGGGFGRRMVVGNGGSRMGEKPTEKRHHGAKQNVTGKKRGTTKHTQRWSCAKQTQPVAQTKTHKGPANMPAQTCDHRTR